MQRPLCPRLISSPLLALVLLLASACGDDPAEGGGNAGTGAGGTDAVSDVGDAGGGGGDAGGTAGETLAPDVSADAGGCSTDQHCVGRVAGLGPCQKPYRAWGHAKTNSITLPHLRPRQGEFNNPPAPGSLPRGL